MSAISDICLQEDSIAQWYSNVFRVALNVSKIFIEELLIKEISNAEGGGSKSVNGEGGCRKCLQKYQSEVRERGTRPSRLV